MNLSAAPAFFANANDNDIRVTDRRCNETLVPPHSPAPTNAALEASRLALAAILVTHHRDADRIDGVACDAGRDRRLGGTASTSAPGWPIDPDPTRTWKNGFR